MRRAQRAIAHLRLAEEELRSARRSGQAVERRALSQQTADHELRAVISVDQFGTVTAAARHLGISQPAVNRSLRSLERRLQRALFHRTPQGMTPTPAGSIVIRRAKLALSEIRQAREEIESLQGIASGQLRVGVLPLARIRLVPQAVHRLLQEQKHAQVAVQDGLYGALLNDLRCGDIDVIVGTIRVPPPVDDIASEEFFQDDVAIVTRADHPVQKRRNVTLKGLLKQDWVLPFKGVPLRSRFEAMLEQESLPLPASVIETNSLAVLRTLLLEGNRFALVSRHQIFLEETTGLLKAVSLPLACATRPVGLTLRKDFAPTPLMRELMKHMRAVAAEIDNHPAAQTQTKRPQTALPPSIAASQAPAHANSGTSSQ